VSGRAVCYYERRACHFSGMETKKPPVIDTGGRMGVGPNYLAEPQLPGQSLLEGLHIDDASLDLGTTWVNVVEDLTPHTCWGRSAMVL
jgi:hypothetical protein